MKIGVLGTGIVGRTIGTRLVGLGHEVVMGSRTADNPAAGEWAAGIGAGASCGTFADAGAGADLFFNCTLGTASIDALGAVGADRLGGKLVVDVSNPLDFFKGMPPSLWVCNTDSLGEQIQRAFPDALVVKTLNTMNCEVMVDPSRVPGDHDVFRLGQRGRRQGPGEAVARELRVERRPRHRPGRHHDQPRPGDVPATVARAVRRARDRDAEHQGRAIAGADSRSVARGRIELPTPRFSAACSAI